MHLFACQDWSAKQSGLSFLSTSFLPKPHYKSIIVTIRLFDRRNEAALTFVWLSRPSSLTDTNTGQSHHSHARHPRLVRSSAEASLATHLHKQRERARERDDLQAPRARRHMQRGREAHRHEADSSSFPTEGYRRVSRPLSSCPNELPSNSLFAPVYGHM